MSQKLLQTITALYREKNYTGYEREQAISALYHSLIRDPDLADQFIQLYGIKVENPGYTEAHTPLNELETNWGEKIQYQNSFKELNSQQRLEIATKIIDELQSNLIREYKKVELLEKERKKQFDPKEVEKANKHQSSDRKKIRALSKEVNDYIDSLYLDISKTAMKELLIKNKDIKEDQIFYTERPFTPEKEEEFRSQVLLLSGEKNEAKLAGIKSLVDRFLKNRHIKTHNKIQYSETKSAEMSILSKTYLKESIFTIPKERQAVFYDPNTLKEIAREFTKKYYSGYNCAFAIHKDELSVLDCYKLHEKGLLSKEDYNSKIRNWEGRQNNNFSGDHLHIFISGWDQQGNHNLLKHEKTIIAKYAFENDLKDAQGNHINFFKHELTKKEQRLYGRIKQTLFREFFNEYLEKEGLIIKKLEIDERDPKFDLKSNAQAINQTKEMRNEQYNLEALGFSFDLKDEITELKREVAITQTKIQKLHDKEAELDIELPFYEKEQKDLIDQRLETYEENEKSRIKTELEQQLLNSNTELQNNLVIIEAQNKEIEEKQAQKKALEEVLNNKTVLENEFNLSKNKLKEAVKDNIHYKFRPEEDANFYSMDDQKEQKLLTKHRKDSFDFHTKFDFTPRDIYFEEDSIFGKKKKKRKETEEEIQNRYYEELNKSNVLKPLIERDKLYDQVLDAIKDIRNKEEKTFVNKQIENFNNVWNNLFNKSLTDTQKELEKERKLRQELETKIQQTQQKLKEEIENSNSWKKSYDSLEKSFLSYKTAIVTLFSNLSDKRYSILELAKIAFKGEWHNPINKDLRDIENSVNEAKAYPETPITIQLLDENGDEIKKPEIKRGLNIK